MNEYEEWPTTSATPAWEELAEWARYLSNEDVTLVWDSGWTNVVQHGVPVYSFDLVGGWPA